MTANPNSLNNQQGFPKITQPLVDTATGIINTGWYQLLLALWQRTGSAQGAQTFATGDIKASASAAPQSGWLSCDGSAVSRSNFSNLFATIGTTWGSGDGTTTFNLPNFTGKILIGASTTYSLGSTGGNATQQITIANLPPHSHDVTDPGHVHTALAAGTNAAGNTTGGATAGDTGSATTGITIGDTGGGTPLPILPPYGAVTWLIKT